MKTLNMLKQFNQIFIIQRNNSTKQKSKFLLNHGKFYQMIAPKLSTPAVPIHYIDGFIDEPLLLINNEGSIGIV